MARLRLMPLRLAPAALIALIAAPAPAAEPAPRAAIPAWTAPAGPADRLDRADIIEDFESGAVMLGSYQDQDADPDAWELTGDNTWDGSAYSLRLYGNTWKTQAIAPRAVEAGTVWQVAVFVESIGEMQAIGLRDGAQELFYTFAGEQLSEDPSWWTVYQGAYPKGQWRLYLLPVGEDWQATHGYLPVIDTLVYVNDCDFGNTAVTLFDAVADVTEDMPVAPAVTASYQVERLDRVSDRLWRAGVQFYAAVVDPDSDTHDFAWDFGDSTASDEQNPYHEFLVLAHYDYAVACRVTDPDGMVGGDTLQVAVEPGAGELPVTVNFVGDIMTARRYEDPGGIIDTYGVEAIYAPTVPILGQAADLSVANLECPFTDQGEPHPTKSVVLRARPENLRGVAWAGIDLVDLGNNHTIDYGEPGLLQTQRLLDSLGIRWMGAASTDYFAKLPAFWTERGVRMAFLGMSNRTGRRWNYQPFLDAGASKPGFAYLLPSNLEEAIGAARDQADVLIVQFHSGDEYQGAPAEPGEPGGAKIAPARPPTAGMEAGAGAVPGAGAEPGAGAALEAAAIDPELARRLEALVEADAIGPDDPSFRFRNEPTPGERELRWLACDLGADVVINHHPHVLQGFEAYDGKLIAHSLGNFIFDLYYAETMPTIVLTLAVNKEGVAGASFVPAWIDDYITQPATGGLAREIIDRMADYSRPMNALVAPDYEADRARVYVNPDEVEPVVTQTLVTVPLVETDGAALSAPIALAGAGFFSRVVSVTGSGLGDYELSWGRELLWHGGFEAEGATYWDVNSGDEWIDETVAHAGQRSLTLRRDQGDGQAVGTDLEGHVPCDPDKRHSFAGWMRGSSASEANVLARFYPTRGSESPLSSTDLGPTQSGDFDWTWQWRALDTPTNALYFELRCTMNPVGGGEESRSWFDELKFVEWEPWTAGEPDLEIPHPNNLRYLQIRAADPQVTSVDVLYEETSYSSPYTAAPAPAAQATARLRQNFPNPFNPATTLRLEAPGGAGAVRARLAIYDVQGRRLRALFDGSLPGGSRRDIVWDGRDDAGRELPSGVYFARADMGGSIESRKLVMLR